MEGRGVWGVEMPVGIRSECILGLGLFQSAIYLNAVSFSCALNKDQEGGSVHGLKPPNQRAERRVPC